MTTDTAPATPPAPPPSISTLEARLNDAARKFQRGKQALYRSDGQPAFTDHQERLDALQAEADAVYREAEEQADRIAKAAYAEQERERRVDPLEKLTTAEMEKAAARRQFVKEDAERLPVADLVTRLRDTLDGSDRALWALWVRYAEARLGDLERRPQEITAADVNAAGELRRLVAEGRARFVNQAAIERAEAREREAAEFRMTVWRRLSAETDAGAREQARLRARYRL